METIKTLKTRITRKIKELEHLENTEGIKNRKQKIMQELTELDLKLNLLKEQQIDSLELDKINNLTFIDNLNNTLWKDLQELKDYLLDNNYVYDFYENSFVILRYDYFDDKEKCLQEQELYETNSGSFTFIKTLQGISVSL